MLLINNILLNSLYKNDINNITTAREFLKDNKLISSINYDAFISIETEKFLFFKKDLDGHIYIDIKIPHIGDFIGNLYCSNDNILLDVNFGGNYYGTQDDFYNFFNPYYLVTVRCLFENSFIPKEFKIKYKIYVIQEELLNEIKIKYK
jgi:hypothetical protein